MDQRPGLNPITEEDNQRARAWRVFFEASGRLQGVLETRLKRVCGLSMPDYNILLALWEAPERRLRMGELAERVVYSPSRVTYLVSNLTRDGWVVRIPSADDGRGFDAVLTPQGVTTVLSATRLHQDAVREFLLDLMSDEQIEEIVRVFSLLDTRLRAQQTYSGSRGHSEQKGNRA
ncbi:MarR family transcriptional regulator [Actinomyces sp. B33]|uniref:MarR family winged helix-turn-helix transcriptional regulator n=1 Tax=Actinomyces sp. B33 TaxID=2942131 RepID=UPI00233FD551|nr:MarR family transcriptional regulator [Actinomyces sp. B33]MDC4233365.1 MarR family transcriptional regulator [Actinomyces sp. B33]